MKPDLLRESEAGPDEANPLSVGGCPLAERILETSLDGIMVCDGDARIIWVNPAFVAMMGFDAEKVLGETPRILRSGFHDETFYQAMRATISRTGYWQGEIWNQRENGGIFPVWADINVIHDISGGVGHYVVRYSDLDNHQDLRKTLHRMAYFDAVTELPNRNLFRDRLQQALLRATRAHSMLAVLFLDLDGFKTVNDTFGHDVGDQMLRAVAERLARCMREGDTLSRLGGDEFAAVLPDLAERATAAQVAERIVHVLAPPFHLGSAEVSATASIGISFFPDDGVDAATLVRHADAAMYCAKDDCGDGYRFFGG